MIEQHMVDPMGTLIAELRALSIASGRVRGEEPAGAIGTYEGDALGPGHYKRFVVLSLLVPERLGRVPLAHFQYAFRAYGVTAQDAAALYNDVSDGLHLIGPRVGGTGLLIYQSLQEFGTGPGKDPATGQPFAAGVIEVIAGTRLVAAGS